MSVLRPCNVEGRAGKKSKTSLNIQVCPEINADNLQIKFRFWNSSYRGSLSALGWCVLSVPFLRFRLMSGLVPCPDHHLVVWLFRHVWGSSPGCLVLNLHGLDSLTSSFDAFCSCVKFPYANRSVASPCTRVANKPASNSIRIMRIFNVSSLLEIRVLLFTSVMYIRLRDHKMKDYDGWWHAVSRKAEIGKVGDCNM